MLQRGKSLRLVLDRSVKQARDIMDAAWKGLVAVSSDSISHLARLVVAGKSIMYEKNRAGRIAVWPLAGISLWEKGNGNVQPASRVTFALPAMKAMYRVAGLPFPDVDTHGDAEAVKAHRAEIQTQTKKLIKYFEGEHHAY